MHAPWRGWFASLSIGLLFLAIEPPCPRMPAELRADDGATTATAGTRQGFAPGQRRPDVIFVPTHQSIVEQILKLAEVKEGDVVYDLGCGDGRIVVTAAKTYGVKAVGIDIDPKRVRESSENVRKNKVSDLVTIKQADLFTEDLSEASVVTLYLLPNLNERLRPQLEQLKPGARVVSHSFPVKGVKPNKVLRVKTGDGGVRTLFLYTVPFAKDAR